MIKNILFLIFISISYNYNWEPSKTSSKIDSAIKYLYNFEFDLFFDEIDIIKNSDPIHPLIPFLEMAGMWQYDQIENGYFSSYKTINKCLIAIKPHYEQLIKQYPNNPEYPLYLGSSYGMLSRISLAMGDYKNVIINGYNALKYIREARSIDSKLYDVYMPIGLMEYFSCKSNLYISSLGNLFGIKSNCSDALEKLEIARFKSKYSWIESSNILVHAYLYFENDYVKAAYVLNDLRSSFPHNPYYLFSQAELYVRTKRWDLLDSIRKNLIEETKNGSKYKNIECLTKYEYILAVEDFSNGEYIKSIEKSTSVIENYTLEFDWIKGFSYLLIGKSYDMLCDRERAIKNYKKSMEYTEYFPEYLEADSLIIYSFKND